LLRAADWAASTSAARSHGLPLRVVAGRRLPALSLFPGGSLAGPWRQSRPSGQVDRGREATPGDADLSDEDLRDAPPNPGNRSEQHHRLRTRADTLSDLATDPLKEPIQDIKVDELLGAHETLMRLELARECLLAVRERLA
jgi:hypothetical protein